MIDYFVDNVTAPIVEPILSIWAEENAEMLSTFSGSTPWVVEA
jgi:hypothetical protein